MGILVIFELLVQATFGHVQIHFIPLPFDGKGEMFHDLFDAFLCFTELGVMNRIDEFVLAKRVASLVGVKPFGKIPSRADLNPSWERFIRNNVKVSTFHSQYNFLYLGSECIQSSQMYSSSSRRYSLQFPSETM